MKPFPPAVAASLLLLVAAAGLANARGDDRKLARGFAFETEADSLRGWVGGYGGEYKEAASWTGPFTISLDKGNAHAGQGALRMEIVAGPSEPIVLNSPPIAAGRAMKGRHIRIRFFARTRDIPPGALSVAVLERDGAGRVLGGQKSAAAVSPDAAWHEAAIEGDLGESTVSAVLLVTLTADRAPGSLWVDDVSVDITMPPEPAARFSSPAKGNIFTDSVGRLVLTIDNPAELAGGEVVVADENGDTLKTWTVPAGTGEFPVPLAGKGFYAVTALLRYPAGRLEKASTAAAVVGPLPDETERMQSRFGLWNVQGDPDLLVAAGARWNRDMTTMKDLKPEILGQSFDQAKPPAAPGPLTTVGVISFGLPLWLMEENIRSSHRGYGNPLQKPRDWKQLGQLVQAYVKKRGASFPPYFEIYNEPEFQWEGSNKDLVTFLAVVADAVKAARPDVTVLGPGMASIRLTDPPILDLRTVRDQGLLDHLDGIAIHAYVDGTPPEGLFIERVKALKDFLAEAKKPGFPIHLTEFGWTTGEGTWQRPVSALTQAQYLSRSLTLLSALGVQNATYFCLRFDAKGGEADFSVLNADSTPKPAYAAFANVARWLVGAHGLGTWLQVTPTTQLVLFEDKAGWVGVAWDTEGARSLVLPAGIQKAEDIMGRSVEADKTGTLHVSPSPVFFRLGGGPLKIETLPARTVMRGGSLPLPPGEAPIVPAPLQSTEKGIAIPADARPGKYLVGAKSAEGIRFQPLDVASPFQVMPHALAWPKESEFPLLRIPVRSFADEPLNAGLALRLPRVRTRFLDGISLEAGKESMLTVPLDGLAEGVRYKGDVSLATNYGGRKELVRQDVDVTVLSCARAAGGGPDWNAVPKVDFSLWGPSKGPIEATDCSATFQAAYGASGLHLRIVVRDDSHLADEEAKMMWKKDSIQIGLDPDVEKAWEGNNLFGLKGHRVFGYGVALTGGGVKNWRWVSYSPELPADTGESRLIAAVKRSGDLTEYEITFPWALMALEKMPPEGSAIGIAVLVNDADAGKAGRKALGLFGGILDGNDPMRFGTMWLR